MRVELILQHGWGFDARVWNAWLRPLAGMHPSVLIHVGERGYYGAQSLTPHFIDSGALKVLVTHSLGLHLIPRHCLAQADILFMCGSFLSFHPDDQLSNRRSKRIVRNIRQKLAVTPYTVLSDFLKLCYTSDDDSRLLPLATVQQEEHLDLDRLTCDLDILDRCDLFGEVTNIRSDARICVMHGTADHVVSPDKAIEIAELLRQTKLALIEQGSHALPLTHTAVCIETLREALIGKLETRYANLSS